jgi:hypothetical protein
VQSDKIHPFILKAAAEFHQAVKVRLLTQAEFYAKAFLGMTPNQSDKGGGFIGIGHPADAGAKADYGRGGASHVKINPGAFLPVQEGGRRRDLAGIGAYKLVDHAGGTGTGVNVIGFKGTAAYKGSGADHLGKIFIAAAETFNQFPERPVAQFRHGC